MGLQPLRQLQSESVILIINETISVLSIKQKQPISVLLTGQKSP